MLDSARKWLASKLESAKEIATQAHLWCGELLGLTRYDNCLDCTHCTGMKPGGIAHCDVDGEDTDGICDVSEAVWCHRFERRDEPMTNNVSDGHHTFDDLYMHRTVLFACLCNQENYPDDVFKSRHHSDGTMYDGFFIAGVNTTFGWVTYHCENKYWDLFDVRELDMAPEWDGCTPAQGLMRLVYEYMPDDVVMPGD